MLVHDSCQAIGTPTAVEIEVADGAMFVARSDNPDWRCWLMVQRGLHRRCAAGELDASMVR